MTTVFADSDSDSESGPTTLGTTTSTVTTAPLTTSEVSSSTTASDTDTTTGEEQPCNYDAICDDDETPADCLHDCGECEPDGVCDETNENPFSCPEDCAATSCNFDGEVDPLEEQCDDANYFNDDPCTDTCQLNVCGDGLRNLEAEDCDDGNLDDSDGCNNNCEQAVHLVFLSSKSYQGDLKPGIGQLKGVALGDAHCQKLADAADLPGIYMAWLSGDSETDDSPDQRFGFEHKYGGRYERVDGMLLGTSWIDFRSGMIENPINVLEDGTKKNSSSWVWTNTASTGSSVGMINCKQWTSKIFDGDGGDITTIAYSGKSDATSPSWSRDTTRPCSNFQRLYCVQTK